MFCVLFTLLYELLFVFMCVNTVLFQQTSCTCFPLTLTHIFPEIKEVLEVKGNRNNHTLHGIMTKGQLNSPMNPVDWLTMQSTLIFKEQISFFHKLLCSLMGA